MNEKYYTINTDLKKKLLKKYINNQVGYKKWSIIANTLKILAVVIPIAIVCVFVIPVLNTEDLLINLLASLIVGSVFFCVSFVIGYVIKLSGDSKYAHPYSIRVRENILISEDGVKFIYHNLENENANSIDSYEIPKENMNAVIYNLKYHIVKIIGEAKLIAYENIERTIINEKKSQRKFYSNSPYEIMLAFDGEEEIVKLLKDMAKNYRDKLFDIEKFYR